MANVKNGTYVVEEFNVFVAVADNEGGGMY